MEIDQTSTTNRKRVRDEKEQPEEEDLKQLEKRARIEIREPPPAPEYDAKQRNYDWIQENYITNLLGFNADIFGGIAALLPTKDLVKINELNFNHKNHAFKIVNYADSQMTDLVWAVGRLGIMENPGRYQNITTFQTLTSNNAPGTRISSKEVMKYSNRVWYAHLESPDWAYSNQEEQSPDFLNSFVNLERLTLQALVYRSTFQQLRDIIIPQSVWWLEIYMSSDPRRVSKSGLSTFGPLMDNAKSHIKFLKLYTNYKEINPATLLSDPLSVLRVMYLNRADESNVTGSDPENTMIRSLDVLIIGTAHAVPYPLLKVQTVFIDHLGIDITETFNTMNYTGIHTLCIRELSMTDMNDIFMLHSLFTNQEKTFPTLQRLVLCRPAFVDSGYGAEVDEDFQPFPLPTYHTMTDRWIPQIEVQIMQFNHFPALNRVEIVLPNEHNVVGLPIEHKFDQERRVIVIYDHATKPNGSFDIEQEVQKSVMQDGNSIGHKHKHRYEEEEESEAPVDENDPEHDFLDETTLGETLVANGAQDYDSDEDFDVNYGRNYSPAKHRQHLDKTRKREQQKEQQKERLKTLNKAIKKERYERKIDSIIPKDVTPISSENACTNAMTYKRHFPMIHYCLFYCDDFDKTQEHNKESYYDCVFVENIVHSGTLDYIAKKGDQVDQIDINTKENTIMFVMKGKKYQIRMAFLLYDSKVLNKFPTSIYNNKDGSLEPTIRLPLSRHQGWVGPKHHRDEDNMQVDDGKQQPSKKIKADDEEDDDDEDEHENNDIDPILKYVTVCGVQIPQVLVPEHDRSIDQEKMKTYISKLPKEKQEYAEVILRNTTYVDFTTFVSWLKVAIDDLEFNLRNTKHAEWDAYCIGNKSSGLWIYILSKYISTQLYDDEAGGSVFVIGKSKAPSEIDNETVVFFDDASYSGTQLSEKIEHFPKLMFHNKKTHIYIHVVVAALSLEAIVNILWNAIVEYMEVYKHNEEIKTLVRNHVLTVFEIEPGLNMDKRSSLFEDLVVRAVELYDLQLPFPERLIRAKDVKICFHYGHIIDTLSNEIQRKPFLTPFQYNQRKHDLSVLDAIQNGYDDYDDLHAYYFQHKMPDWVSSYTSLYQGYILSDDKKTIVDRYPFVRGCDDEEENHIGESVATANESECPVPPYKEYDLQDIFNT